METYLNLEKLSNDLKNLFQNQNQNEKKMKILLKEDLIPNQISEKLIQFQKLQENENEKELNQFIEKEKSFIFKTRFTFQSEIIQEVEHINKLKEWINDNEFFFKIKLGFSAKRDGFDCKNWHSKVDGKGKTLVIIKTEDNFIFGGFTQVGWTTDRSKWREEDRRDSNAFIFSLRNDKGDRKPEKFSIQKGKEQFSIYFNYSYFGPFFGNGYSAFPDFHLEENLKTGWSNFGNSYNLPNGITYKSNEAKSYLAGSYSSWRVDELETYFN
ncbi:hypothetical protein M0811_13699 [Anaeramoeba ignava]|uniref:TLDc domain-containing protein n=1 Tax=Anaeramoeba ignava TaxID=1746090 RepID=A0A9Q0L7Q1_ANAIG|nr:hypothetical protein M0811_13699 [Anaeramoeba ignava]